MGRMREARDEQRSLHETYRQKLRLDAPANYWNSLRREARWAAAQAFVGFIIAVIAIAVILWQTAPAFRKFLTDSSGKIDLGAVVLIAPLLIIVLWIFRMISRLFTT